MISSAKIRQDFLDFFASKGHTIVPSASVIPADDPTLLFTNAGMNQFKDVFLGTGKRSYSRCANTQKCIRVSGKHNDLEEVGHDNFHHTFFEMLGNWSFGDYYKKEAIIWAWELLTDVWKINKNKLWVTVFENDEEAFELWKTYTDIANSHILKFGVKDNFWEMGDTGPCGPCSEIHYDFTSNGCSASDINSGNPDVMEIWNLVFIQYNRDSNGELNDLPQKHIDTGMGFERIVRVLQNTSSNYLTDIFSPLINELINITGKDYYGNFIAPMNVISDHIRTLTFAIADGAIPSNESRGYVLRRILRRAARYGRNLDMHKPFIFKLVDVLVNTMGNVFPEIIDKKDFIKEVIKSEEESFNLTLDKGIALFNEEIQKLKTQNSVYFSGEAAFKLHDTYGFPIDLTQLMAKESGFDVDINTFNQKMQDAKNLSRLNLSDSAPQNFELINLSRIDTANLIYNPWVNTNKIETYIIGTEKISDNEIALMLANNPFYKESGGQVSDLGSIIINGYNFNILNVLTQNIVTTEYNEIFKPGLKIIAHLDFTRRLDIQRNHSATHLVHEALKRVLGPHIKQMGSYLDNQILRFDFPHFHKLTENEITEIENIVNSKISENIEVYDIKKMPFEEAKKIPNIKMFFGEKYGEFVRVVFIDEKFSVELCGGTHVLDTSDIGLFKIIKEESVSSGIRRIFAKTGKGIIDFINHKIIEIENILSNLPQKYHPDFLSAINSIKTDLNKSDFRDIKLMKSLIELQSETYDKLIVLREKYLLEKKKIEKQLINNKINEFVNNIDKLLNEMPVINNVKLFISEFNADNIEELQLIADKVREKLINGAGLLYSIINNKVILVTVVTDNLIKEKNLNAGKLASEVAKVLGGGGGGKPHLASAGGKNPALINQAINHFKSIIEGI